MIYTIGYQISLREGATIIDDILLIQAISSSEALKDAIRLLDEEYPGGIVLKLECIGVQENA